MEPATEIHPSLETTHSEFFFWTRGVLSRWSGVVTMAFWLHTGVDVRDGFSKSWVSCFVQWLKNWNNTCQLGNHLVWCHEPAAKLMPQR